MKKELLNDLVVRSLRKNDPAGFASGEELFELLHLFKGPFIKPKRIAVDLNDPCVNEKGDSQMIRGATDQRGRARMTIPAVERRCSDVFDYILEVVEECKREEKNYLCKVSLTMTVRHYDAEYVVDESGYDEPYIDFFPELRKDKRGDKVPKVDVAKSSWTMSGSNKKKTYLLALKLAGKLLRRELLEIRAFQIHAPIVSVRGQSVYLCLGRDLVSLDLPFRVVYQTRRGEREVGFIKARDIYDGCTMTRTLERRDERGRRVRIEPMRAQKIYGNIKPGFTAWEVPQIGLQLGGGLALSTLVTGVSPMLGLAVEQSLASWLGISELHGFAHLRFGGLFAPEDVAVVRTNFLQAFPTFEPLLSDWEQVPVGQIDLGVLKRVYLGRLFIDLQVAASMSWYHLGEISDPFGEAAGNPEAKLKLGLLGVGGVGKAGVGLQLSPRLALRGVLGYRFSGTIPIVLNDEYLPQFADGMPIVPTDGFKPLPEAGLLIHFGGLYLF